MTTDSKRNLPAWLPYAIGALLVVQFMALSVWQISRGLDKQAERDAFDSVSGFTPFRDGVEVHSFQPIRAEGRFLGDRQFLFDNIIINSRYGYYVVTAYETGKDEPLLMVNRGWIEKQGPNPDLDAVSRSIQVTEALVTVRGRVGSFPKPGMRMGEAIASRDRWPQVAVFPTAEDVAASLGREVQPFLLLLDPEAEHGYLRHWVPEEMGPGTHFGYALQWFAMGAVLAGLLVWNFRKRGFETDEGPGP